MTHVLTIRDLNVEFIDRGKVTNRPVRGIDLDVSAGEILGLVGETGCGKSLTGLAALGILPRGARRTGQVTMGGDPLQPSSEPDGPAAIVFQNPGTAFNPVFTLGRQLSDVLVSTGRSRGPTVNPKCCGISVLSVFRTLSGSSSVIRINYPAGCCSVP